MKYIKITMLLLSTLTLSLCEAQRKPCPQSGNSKSKSFQYRDSLKNRSVIGVPQNILLSDILVDGDDRKRFSQTQFITVSGYVMYMVPGGPEGSNCNTKDEKKWDLHIFIGMDTINKSKSRMLVVELTPYSYSINPLWQNKKFQSSLIGKKVTITGWLFWDYGHFRNAENTAKFSSTPGDIWRKTCWEIHPITNLIVN